jgi:hypothetical protein
VREYECPYIAFARDGAARLNLARGDPEVEILDPAEQGQICMPHHGHVPNLHSFFVLVLHGDSFRVRAEHTWRGTKCLAVVALRG